MITIIAGTNRPGSNTAHVARAVEACYRRRGVPAQVMDLGLLPPAAFAPGAYAQKPEALAPFTESILQSAGVVVVTPEYNGSFPGVLKYFIDLLKFPESFQARPVAFVGLSNGQWGALRAVEHLQQIFAYRNAHLLPERVFLPGIRDCLDGAGDLNQEGLAQRLEAQAEAFVRFIHKLTGVDLTAPAGHARRYVPHLGVCSWSLQPETPEILVEKLEELGLKRLQLWLDPLREKPAVWGRAPELLARAGVTVVSGMFGCVGEDYSTLESIRRTGGVVPDHTWEQNWANIQENARLAQRLGLKYVAFHAGFLPHDAQAPEFAKLVERLRRIAQLFGEAGITLGLETGQESAATLREFLVHLGCPNVGVNFDPANMILYDQGNPVFALRLLGPWVKQCHLKDATRTRQPGTWGEEVPVGTGQVNWRGFFQTLSEIGFHGNLCIEREAGQQRVADILAARRWVETLP
ncbi:MAG: TIM barrel protein [Verrucomicrobiae bacterium]|nr:TIM barrel protein [Verrucomicrobiae bacterium]